MTSNNNYKKKKKKKAIELFDQPNICYCSKKKPSLSIFKNTAPSECIQKLNESNPKTTTYTLTVL